MVSNIEWKNVMSSIVRWYLPGRIAYVVWPKNLNWEMILETNQYLLDALDACNAPLHIIGDARFTDDVQVLNLYLRREKNFIEHPALGWTLNIAHNLNAGMMGHALPQHAKASLYRSFHDVYDALEFLSIQDRSLPWNLADNSVLAITAED